MFDLGWGELVVIGIVALIAIGPKELPTVLRTLGQWMGKVRRMANEFQGQFQEALREAEFADLKKHAQEFQARSARSATSIRWPTRRRTSSAPSRKPAADTTAPATPAIDAASPAPAAPSEPELPLPLPAIDVPLPEPPPPSPRRISRLPRRRLPENRGRRMSEQDDARSRPPRRR